MVAISTRGGGVVRSYSDPKVEEPGANLMVYISFIMFLYCQLQV